MELAIIIEKDSTGHIKTIRSTSGLLTPKLDEQAKALDKYLVQRIPEIEGELISKGLMSKTVPKNVSNQVRGNVLLWHELGSRLRSLCEREGIIGRRERRWLWEAVDNIYATPRIKRVKRGRTRIHFEYCFRVSKYPIEFAEQVNWSEWVYYFDSRTIRDEPRADAWLYTLVQRGQKMNRRIFRRFVQQLNKRVRGLDTSVFTQEELFRIYEATWNETVQEIRTDN